MKNTYGFILAAGLGTRLRPLTDNKPKALVEVLDKSLLEWNILRLKGYGIEVIVINVFHFAEQIIDFVKSRDWGVEIRISDERPTVLETGGGLLYARELFDGAEHILIWNVDILSRVDVELAYEKHIQNGAMATLFVSDRASSRKLLWKDSVLVGWHNLGTDQFRWVDKAVSEYTELAFSGIQIVSHEIFQNFVRDGKFSIIETYFSLARHKFLVQNQDYTGEVVLDVGKLPALPKAEAFLKTQ